MLEIERHKLELCYNQTMNPSTQKTLFFGYPSKFLRELCVTHLRMYGSAKHHEECNGFQMILTMEASDGADKIKVIRHEEMDDVELEDEDIDETEDEELENNGKCYCIHSRYLYTKHILHIYTAIFRQIHRQ